MNIINFGKNNENKKLIEKVWTAKLCQQFKKRLDIPLGGTRPTEVQKIGLILTMIYPNKKVIPKVVR